MLRYPHINPIAFSIGPVKVHWYGIMYLLGFAGAWWLARRRAAAPGSTWKANDVDDLIFFAMLGVILGGRIGYVLFYGMSFWAQRSLVPGQDLGGRHVLPRRPARGGARRSRCLPGAAAAASATSSISPRRCRPSGCFSAASATSSTASCGARSTDRAVGFPVVPRARCAIPRSCTRRRSRAWCCSSLLWVFTARPRPRLAPSGLFLLIYGVARFLVEFVRVPDAADRLSRRRLAHRGAAAVAADDPRRRRAARLGLPRTHAFGQLR